MANVPARVRSGRRIRGDSEPPPAFDDIWRERAFLVPSAPDVQPDRGDSRAPVRIAA